MQSKRLSSSLSSQQLWGCYLRGSIGILETSLYTKQSSIESAWLWKANEPFMTDEHDLRVTFQGRTVPAVAYLDDIWRNAASEGDYNNFQHGKNSVLNFSNQKQVFRRNGSWFHFHSNWVSKRFTSAEWSIAWQFKFFQEVKQNIDVNSVNMLLKAYICTQVPKNRPKYSSINYDEIRESCIIYLLANMTSEKKIYTQKRVNFDKENLGEKKTASSVKINMLKILLYTLKRE